MTKHKCIQCFSEVELAHNDIKDSESYGFCEDENGELVFRLIENTDKFTYDSVCYDCYMIDKDEIEKLRKQRRERNA